jgi:hypothetical protein
LILLAWDNRRLFSEDNGMQNLWSSNENDLWTWSLKECEAPGRIVPRSNALTLPTVTAGAWLSMMTSHLHVISYSKNVQIQQDQATKSSIGAHVHFLRLCSTPRKVEKLISLHSYFHNQFITNHILLLLLNRDRSGYIFSSVMDILIFPLL